MSKVETKRLLSIIQHILNRKTQLEIQPRYEDNGKAMASTLAKFYLRTARVARRWISICGTRIHPSVIVIKRGHV